MEKRKTRNKALKTKVENKEAAIDWSKIKYPVTVIGIVSKHLTEGKEYKGLSVETAKALVTKGVAKLK